MHSKETDILIKKTVNKLIHNKSSKFITMREKDLILPILNKQRIPYNVYTPYVDADKCIIYGSVEPTVSCLKIITKNVLKHSDILGSIFTLSIEIDNFGDIIIDGDNYYIILLSEIESYVLNNLIDIGRYRVKLEKIDMETISDFKRKFQELFVKCNSLRLDGVLAKILNLSRNSVNLLFKEKEVLLNNDLAVNNSYNLKSGDTFSVRGKGKYKYIGIEKTTKNSSLVLIINKYM